MRLFDRDGRYYVETDRDKRRSLKTSDPALAEKIFKKLQREYLMGRLVSLESESKKTLKEFTQEYLKDRGGLSEDTRRQDKIALNNLASVIGENTLLKQIDKAKINLFKRTCLNIGCGKKPRPLAIPSINSYLRHIKAAMSEAVRLGHIRQRPEIKMFKEKKSLPRFLWPEQIKAVLEKARELRPKFALWLTFYLWTGARRMEGLNIKWEDCSLDGRNPFCILNGKGEKQRIVPLHSEILDILREMKKEIEDAGAESVTEPASSGQQPPKIVASGYVFPRIDKSTVSHWFHDIALACDPPIHARLHDLRHTAATYMLASGVPIKMVQEIMGHEDIATTQIYLDIIKEHLHREMKKLKFELD